MAGDISVDLCSPGRAC